MGDEQFEQCVAKLVWLVMTLQDQEKSCQPALSISPPSQPHCDFGGEQKITSTRNLTAGTCWNMENVVVGFFVWQ